MEIMYSNKSYDLFTKNTFTGLYKDKQSLVKMGIEFEGILFDDEWTVKRFLNGFKIRVNEKIYDIFEELCININLLNRKIKTLSKVELKLILFSYVILNNKDFIVLDYFDKGLSYINKKRIINYLKRKYNGTLVVISNDLVFLNSLCNKLIVFKEENIVFNDDFNMLYKSKIKIGEV